MLRTAAAKLLQTVGDAAATEEQINAAAQSFFDAVSQSSLATTNEVLGTLSKAFALEDTSRAGFVALICGALVEKGCDPSDLIAPLISRLRTLVEMSARLAEACFREMPPAEDEDEDVDPQEAFEQALERVGPRMPAEASAWNGLEEFWPPAIAVFSVNSEAREAAGDLRPLLEPFADHHSGAH